MARTALAMTTEEWRTYQPGKNMPVLQSTERWQRAWETARVTAKLLRDEFGATRVVAFGSLTQRDWFTPWSDIDLAAWSIPPQTFYRAVALVTGLSPEFKIDLVTPQDCRPTMSQIIEREGIEL